MNKIKHTWSWTNASRRFSSSARRRRRGQKLRMPAILTSPTYYKTGITCLQRVSQPLKAAWFTSATTPAPAVYAVLARLFNQFDTQKVVCHSGRLLEREIEWWSDFPRLECSTATTDDTEGTQTPRTEADLLSLHSRQPINKEPSCACYRLRAMGEIFYFVTADSSRQ